MSSAALVVLLCFGVLVLVAAVAAFLAWSNNNQENKKDPAPPNANVNPTGTGGGGGGAFTLTKYWVPIEGQMDMGDWTAAQGGSYVGERKLNGGTRDKQMLLCKGGVCGSETEKGPKVDYHMFTKCNEEGTCVVGGQVYNLYTTALEPFNNPDASKVVFFKPPNAQWGMGNKNNAIAPFVSVAVNQSQFPYGTKLRVAALQGKRMPTGVIHNGCVRADDVGPRIGKDHIDFFVGKYGWKKELDGGGVGDGKYTVKKDDSCTFLDYKSGNPV